MPFWLREKTWTFPPLSWLKRTLSLDESNTSASDLMPLSCWWGTEPAPIPASLDKAITKHEQVGGHERATHVQLEPVPTFFALWPHRSPIGVPHKQLYPFIFTSPLGAHFRERRDEEAMRLAQGCSRESLAEPEDRNLLLVQGSDILSCTSSHGAPTGAQHGIDEISKIFSIPPTFVQMSPMEMNTAEDVPV